MDDLLSEFLTETNESIDVVDREIVRLEQNPNDKDVLDNVFRLVHTIKGTCGFLGLPRLEGVAHSAENVLGKFRDGDLEITAEAVTLILASLDRIKEILIGLEQTEAEPDGDDSALIGRLDAWAESGNAPGAEIPPAVEPEPLDDGDMDPGLGRELKAGEVSLEELEAAFNAAPGPDLEVDFPHNNVAERDDDPLAEFGGHAGIAGALDSVLEQVGMSGKYPILTDSEKLAALSKTLADVLQASLTNDEEALKVSTTAAQRALPWDLPLLATVSSGLRAELAAFDVPSGSLTQVQTALERQAHLIVPAAQDEVKKREDKSSKRSSSNQTIRVGVDLLEDLMNLVSELVLTRNQLNQMVRSIEDSEFTLPLQRLSQCTTELQEGVMKTRMQPIGNAWSKLPRIIRDLSHELGKDIELDMHGADTELDRQVLELIKDPLTHMVRNSADHGIETPDERLRCGKAEQGTVKLDAYHEGGHIVITIADDGAGINAAKLREKALENGLATDAELNAMSENQIQKFIFHAGLSTAQEVTSVSGRGVGMDVVRMNIEKIGGTVDMTSVMGKGTTFYIKIPLTLAIVSALIVECGDERFAIPQIAVLELVHADASGDTAIEMINNTPVMRLRNSLLPLVYLRDIMGFERKTDTDDAFVVVTQVGSFVFGIVVDQVFDTEEIVVKPVSPALSNVSVYSGNTILGDGSVIMILDPNGVASQVSTTTASDAEANSADAEKLADTGQEIETMLVFMAGNDTPKAVPLSLVARLEELDPSRIENKSVRPTVQYRGALMPILEMPGAQGLKTESKQAVLVFTDDDRSMGIACDEILDIVETALDVDISTQREGIVGNAVIDGKVTEIVDISHFSKIAFKDWFERSDRQRGKRSETGREMARVLVVEDSAFFRNMLRPLLNAAGYAVTVAKDAEEALDLRDRKKDFDLIISDIEMPGISGFEFAESVREAGPWKQTPMIALSSLGTAKDFERGRNSGFNDYVVKLDRDALLDTMEFQLSSAAKRAAA